MGALIGAFSFANFLSSAFLGHLSDNYGRKPFLLSGGLVTVVFSTVLGFLTDRWLAIVSRAMIGLFNANFAIGKAAIADLVPPHLRYGPTRYNLPVQISLHLPRRWPTGSSCSTCVNIRPPTDTITIPFVEASRPLCEHTTTHRYNYHSIFGGKATIALAHGCGFPSSLCQDEMTP